MYKLFSKKKTVLFGCVHNLLLLKSSEHWNQDIFPRNPVESVLRNVKYSYINWMVLSVSEFFPTGWAGIGVPKGITEALTTEDMATFGWHNKSPALHNLEEKKAQQVYGVRNSALLVYWHQLNSIEYL